MHSIFSGLIVILMTTGVELNQFQH